MKPCKFGARCYRKNVQHLRECHPEKMEKLEADGSVEESEKADETLEATKPQEGEPKATAEEVKNGVGDGPKAKKRLAEEDSENGGGEGDAAKRAKLNSLAKTGCESAEEPVKQNAKPPPPQPSNPLKLPGGEKSIPVRAPFLCQPASVFSVWLRALQLQPSEPCSAFSAVNGLRLVGIFDFLDGRLSTSDASDDDVRLHWRFSTDLPEMQTFAISNAGHYSIWRDDQETKDEEMIIVFSSRTSGNHFVKLEIVGDKVENAIAHAAYSWKEYGNEKGSAEVEKCLAEVDIEGAAEHAKKTSSARKKMAIGHPLHGVQICVPVDKKKDIGYRPLGEDIGKLKRDLEKIGETGDEKKMHNIEELFAAAQFANDELDFGMGLELGHDLFSTNFPCFDSMAKQLLSTAYLLLDRAEFGAIVTAQFKDEETRRRSIIWHH